MLLHQDALQLLAGPYMPTLVGIMSGAQSVNGLLQSSTFNTSSFNSLSASGFWSNYSLPNGTRPALQPKVTEGISAEDVSSSYNLGQSLLSSQMTGLKDTILVLENPAQRNYDHEDSPPLLITKPPNATLPYTRAVYLLPWWQVPNSKNSDATTPIAVKVSLAGDG